MKKTTKILACLLSFILAFSMLPMSVLATEADNAEVNLEDGISNAAEFAAMEAGGAYYLTQNISLDVGYAGDFYGVFDGNGYTITLASGSLFATIVGGNTVISNIDLTVTNNTTATDEFGFVANKTGDENTLVINNVHVNGAITATDTQTAVAGFVGVANNITVTDSSFTGSITANENATVGGFVASTGTATTSAATFQNCHNTATVTSGATVGAIVGHTQITTHILDCTSKNAACSLIGNAAVATATELVLVTDSTNTGVTQNTVYGASTSARLCVINCTDQNSTDVIDIASATDFAKIGVESTHPVTGFYCLTAQIDFNDFVYDTQVLDNGFQGVLYGNGNGFENYKHNYAIMTTLGAIADVAVVNTSFELEYMEQGTFSFVADTIGSSDSKCGALIYDVDVKTHQDRIRNRNQQMGALAHSTYTLVCIDSSVTGEIVGACNYSGNRGYNIGGFVGRVQGNSCFIGCDNFANMTCGTGHTGGYFRSAGFVGLNDTGSTMLIDCNNFGTMTNTVDDTDNSTSPFVAQTQVSTIINNCSNFGNLNGGNAGLSVGVATSTAVVMAVGVENYDGSTYESVGNDASNAAKVMDVCSEAPAQMCEGASVRIATNLADSGLRFKSKISENAINKLREIFGDDAVSYGTMIAPTEFIGENEFTFDTLEAFAEKNETALKGEPAHIEVEATTWFVGSNGEEKGYIAGSVTNLTGLYDVSFSGRAYIKVEDENGNRILAFYADYYEDDMANTTRVARNVTKSALDDVLYKKNADDNEWYSDAACQTVSQKADKATYVYPVTVEGGTAYSCYNSNQYKALEALYKAQ